MTTSQSESWIWLGMEMSLPRDWELLQFSLNPEQGRCAWADRFRFRAELSWRRVPGTPDMDRMISDYEAALREAGIESPTRIDHKGWHGIEGKLEGLMTTRYGQCFGNRLVEWVLLNDGPVDRKVEQTLLDGFAIHVNSATQRWRAFGLDVVVPTDYRLSSCSAQPACTEFEFVDKRGQTAVLCGRRGMTEQWLRGSVRSWLSHSLGHDARVEKVEERVVAGHATVEMSGKLHQGLLRRRRDLSAYAWLCPADGRLSSIKRVGSVDAPIRCCGAWMVP